MRQTHEGQRVLEVKCDKHLLLDDAVASGLQLNVAGALWFYVTDQTLHLEAAHGGQV